MWVCLNCFELTSAENENCSKCHTARPGSAKAKLFPKELDNRALNARKECNVNKAIGVIKKISNSERTNVKNENDYIDGMKQRQKQDCQGPVMSIIQRECSPGRPPNINPGGHGWQSDTNQGLQKMSTHLGHNKQPNQFHGKNQPPNQYHRRPQRMYANQGLNQQLNKHQGYNQPQNQYQAYNQPQHQQQYNSGLAGMMSAPLLSAQNMNQPQQNFQYVMVQGPVPSVLPSGQGPTPYPALPMLPYNPGKPQEIQTADDEKESKQKNQHRKKNKNVLNAVAQKPSGMDTYNIEGVSANEILTFVVTTFENGCTFEDFLLQCNLFPSSADIPRWFEKLMMQFHIFKNNEKIEYILPYVKTAGVCSSYNNRQNPGECNNVNCRFLHVCRRFVRNIYCNFKGCKLAHDFTNQHNSPLIERFGLENLRENQIKTVLNNQFPSICRDYNFNERCKVGTKKCVNLHLCGSYKFGKCEKPCKYKRTHKLNNNHNKWVLRAFQMNSWPHDKILKSIYVPPKRAPRYSNNDEGDLDHNKNIDDDDDDVYKSSDFIDLDENFVPPKAESSDSSSDEDES